MKLGDNMHLNVETVPSGSLGLDLALGVGGVPKGRVVEVYGPESGGKTTVALHMVCLIYTSLSIRIYDHEVDERASIGTVFEQFL